MNLYDLIQKHQQSKLKLLVQDVYKLLYQSVLGVGHLLEHPQAGKKSLEKELNTIEASTTDSLIETISTNDEIVRINLRHFKALKLSTEILYKVMILSAKATTGSQPDLERVWSEFKHLVKEGKLNYNKSELKKFDAWIVKNNYPRVHHSEIYRATNRPAYRVIRLSIFRTYFSEQAKLT